MHRYQTGFTLLELLVVMAIAGLLTVLARPMFSAALPGTNLKADTRSLVATLRDSRSTSITSGRQSFVIFCSHSAQYATAPENTTYLSKGVELEVSGLAPLAPTPDSTCDSTLDDAVYRLSFFPDGSSSGAKIILRRPGIAYLVAIDWLTGRATVMNADHVQEGHASL